MSELPTNDDWEGFVASYERAEGHKPVAKTPADLHQHEKLLYLYYCRGRLDEWCELREWERGLSLWQRARWIFGYVATKPAEPPAVEIDHRTIGSETD